MKFEFALSKRALSQATKRDQRHDDKHGTCGDAEEKGVRTEIEFAFHRGRGRVDNLVRPYRQQWQIGFGFEIGWWNGNGWQVGKIAAAIGHAKRAGSGRTRLHFFSRFRRVVTVDRSRTRKHRHQRATVTCAFLAVRARFASHSNDPHQDRALAKTIQIRAES